MGGFVHHDLDSAGPMFANPTFSTTACLDFAEPAPRTMVRVGSRGVLYGDRR